MCVWFSENILLEIMSIALRHNHLVPRDSAELCTFEVRMTLSGNTLGCSSWQVDVIHTPTPSSLLSIFLLRYSGQYTDMVLPARLCTGQTRQPLLE